MWVYQFLDKFFLIFHTSIIFFNLFGWIWKKTRFANLITLFLTLFSWFVLGIWYGFGYCPCTHWHWMVKEKLGHQDLPHSYITFLIKELMGLSFSETLINNLTILFLTLALFAAAYVNIQDYQRSKGNKD